MFTIVNTDHLCEDATRVSFDGLIERLSRKDSTIIKGLDIQVELTHEQFRVLFQSLSHCNSILEIILRPSSFLDCNLSDDSIYAYLSYFLKTNRSLESLTLYHTQINEDALKSIAIALKENLNSKLKHIKITGSTGGIFGIVELLKAYPALETLALHYNPEINCNEFIELTKVLTKLKTLTIIGHNIQDKGFLHLIEMLTRNTTLQKIIINSDAEMGLSYAAGLCLLSQLPLMTQVKHLEISGFFARTPFLHSSSLEDLRKAKYKQETEENRAIELASIFNEVNPAFVQRIVTFINYLRNKFSVDVPFLIESYENIEKKRLQAMSDIGRRGLPEMNMVLQRTSANQAFLNSQQIVLRIYNELSRKRSAYLFDKKDAYLRRDNEFGYRAKQVPSLLWLCSISFAKHQLRFDNLPTLREFVQEVNLHPWDDSGTLKHSI